jgi:hypothetical protein
MPFRDVNTIDAMLPIPPFRQADCTQALEKAAEIQQPARTVDGE